MHDGPLGAKAVGILFGGVTDENKSSRFGEGTEIPRCPPIMQPAAKGPVPEAVDADVPLLTFPPPRYDAILAVLRNALYMFAVFFFLVGSMTCEFLNNFQIWQHLRTGFTRIYPRG